MSTQMTLIALLVLALGLFIWGPWRHDVVALVILLLAAAAGVVPVGRAFQGFSDPAVVTVAAVFVMSRGLIESGTASTLSQRVLRLCKTEASQAAGLLALVTIFSAFMNNVGALALCLPVAVQVARKGEFPPSVLLMPLAFGSLLGGTVTLIGTPANMIVSDFRAQAGGAPFQIFDFAPVGLGLAGAGVLLLCLVGRRLVPRRPASSAGGGLLRVRSYVSELRVPAASPLAGKPIHEVARAADGDVLVASVIRGGGAIPAPTAAETLQAEDLLLVEADPSALSHLVHAAGLELVGSRALSEKALESEEVHVVEAVVTANSPLAQETARSLALRRLHGLNLLAVARQGQTLDTRLADTVLLPGDLLLLQGHADTLEDTLHWLGCLPLAPPVLRFGRPRRIFLATAVCLAALAVTALGLLPVQVSFAAAAAALVLSRVISIGEAYDSIDWSVILLLGAMIPVGLAVEGTGIAREVVAKVLALGGGGTAPGVLVAALLAGTMMLTNVMNNAATAVVMAPVAVAFARELEVSADPFLMAVAVGSTAAFLTPIGHQSNTLVMGPGGYRFEDYWKLGLPVSILTLAAAVPLILWRWPLLPR